MLEILRTFFDHWVVSPICSGLLPATYPGFMELLLAMEPNYFRAFHAPSIAIDTGNSVNSQAPMEIVLRKQVYTHNEGSRRNGAKLGSSAPPAPFVAKGLSVQNARAWARNREATQASSHRRCHRPMRAIW
jgi:hypothetical protein